jgi:multidrug efflux pump subunit AcrA (membrane-fusion protein)
VLLGRGVNYSQTKLQQQIAEAEAAQQEILNKLVASQARLARLRKQKEYINRKSESQSAALEAKLDREEAQEAALQGAVSDLSGAGFSSSNNVPLENFNNFLGMQPGASLQLTIRDFNFRSLQLG